MFQLLDYWCAEVDCEICLIIVTSCVPAFIPVILVRFLVVLQGLYRDSVEVVEIAIDGVVYLAWLGLFGVCCEGCVGE